MCGENSLSEREKEEDRERKRETETGSRDFDFLPETFVLPDQVEDHPYIRDVSKGEELMKVTSSIAA